MLSKGAEALRREIDDASQNITTAARYLGITRQALTAILDGKTETPLRKTLEMIRIRYQIEPGEFYKRCRGNGK